jgi:hypothetical protein
VGKFPRWGFVLLYGYIAVLCAACIAFALARPTNSLVFNVPVAVLSGATVIALAYGPFSASYAPPPVNPDYAYKRFEYERDRVQALSKGVAGTAAAVLTTLLAAGLKSGEGIDAPPRVVGGVVTLCISLIVLGLLGNISTKRLATRLPPT